MKLFDDLIELAAPTKSVIYSDVDMRRVHCQRFDSEFEACLANDKTAILRGSDVSSRFGLRQPIKREVKRDWSRVENLAKTGARALVVVPLVAHGFLPPHI